MASVRVVRENGHALVEIVDDGIGGSRFEPGQRLRGLVDRVEALDGRLDLDSSTGAGICIRAEIRCGETAHQPRGR